jgi:hypothetical protein
VLLLDRRLYHFFLFLWANSAVSWGLVGGFLDMLGVYCPRAMLWDNADASVELKVPLKVSLYMCGGGLTVPACPAASGFHLATRRRDQTSLRCA